MTPKLSLRSISPRRSPGDAGRGVGPSALTTRRDELASAYAETQWDLGGLVYEMARRDHFRMELVVRHAARLQAIDAELDEVDRLLALEHEPVAGTCAGCGAPYTHGAAFCSKCGISLADSSAEAEAASSA